jgi:hypothetical protein
MSELPKKFYSQEQFERDLARLFQEFLDTTHLGSLNFEELKDLESREMIQKYVEGKLKPEDVRAYGAHLQSAGPNKSQKEILEFLSHAPNESALRAVEEEVEKSIQEFQGKVKIMVLESKARGENFFSEDFEEGKLQLVDRDIYNKYMRNEMEFDKLIKRVTDPAEPANASQKEFAYYLSQQIIQRD